MDTDVLVEAMGCSVGTAQSYRGVFNEALIAAQCTTVNRVAMFCAQVGTESAGLRYMQEIADGSEYNGRADLGNTQPGDGPRFKGRGPIQLTGRNNYGAFSRWCFARKWVPTVDYFVRNPTLVAQPRWGFLAASYYWTVARNMNSYADRGDIVGASYAVNGGDHGLNDRTARWNRCRAMGNQILPTGDLLMALSEDEQREILEGARQLKSYATRKVAAEFNPNGTNWSGQAIQKAALELAQKLGSRSKYRDSDDAIDTIAGYILNIDARIHEESVETAALNGDSLAIAKVKKVADAGDAGAKAVLAKVVTK